MAPSRPVLIAAALVVLAGCGPPPEPPAPPTPLPPPATTASPVPTFPVVPPTAGPLPSGGFGEQFAINCGGEPSGDDVLALLRAEGLLDAGTQAQVTDGPRCAGTWQYAVVTVADLDPLQVVTEGDPGGLELIAAGTDVCTPEVRIQAPPGIRDAAACGA